MGLVAQAKKLFIQSFFIATSPSVEVLEDNSKQSSLIL